MANKSLNEKYEIPFGSEWKYKDGGTYIALLVEHAFKGNKIPIVSYVKILSVEDRKRFIANNTKNQFVRTVEHFKHRFKQIE